MPRNQIQGHIAIENVINVNQEPDIIKEQVASTTKQMEEMLSGRLIQGKVTIVNKFVDEEEAAANPVEDTVEQLRKALEAIPGNLEPTNDPFGFTANLLHAHRKDELPIPACAKLDTQSSENWISSGLVTRAGLENDVLPCEESGYLYRGFGGGTFQPAGKIEVTWTRNSAKSWKTIFLVHDSGAPFDLVLGKSFIIEEGLFVFDEPMLAVTRLAPNMTKGTSAPV